MPIKLGGFFDRDPFRTPPFMPGNPVDDGYEQDPYQSTPKPPPMRAPSAEMPTPRPRLGGSLDRFDQIRLPDMPQRPQVGKARGILGTIAGMWSPRLEGMIKDPGGDRREYEYRRQVERAKLLGDMEAKRAQAQADYSRAGASEAQAERDLAGKAYEEKRTAQLDQPKMAEYDTEKDLYQGDKLIRKGSPKASNAPNTIEAVVARIISDDSMTPDAKKAKIQSVGDAWKLVKPEESKTIDRIIEDGVGAIYGASYDPKTQKGTMTKIGQVTPKPRKETTVNVTPGQLSSAAQAVVDNPDIFDKYGAKQRDAILSELQANRRADVINELTGRELGSGDVNRLTTTEAALKRLSAFRKLLEDNKDYLGPVDQVQGRVKDWTQAQKIRAMIDLERQRTGKALEGGVLRKEDEQKYRDLLANVSDLDAVALSKVDDVMRGLEIERDAYLDTASKSGYRTRRFRQKPSGEPKVQSGEKVKMLKPDGTAVMVPKGNVEYREKNSGYKRVP